MSTSALSEYASPWAAGISEASLERHYRLELTAVDSAAYVARHKAGDVLAEWGLNAEDVDTARLLISELITNAVKFGPAGDVPSPAQISLALWLMQGILVIEVSDQSANLPILRPPDAESQGGRGLSLVNGLASYWSWYVPNPGWKTVFCVMDFSLSPGPNRD